METKQKGMRAALKLQKLVPSQQEDTKDGVKEIRQLVLKGDFIIFVEGQGYPQKLPAKLEFKDEPAVVALVQEALNIDEIGDRCLLAVHSNKQGKLDQYFEWLAKKEKQQQLDYGEPEVEDEEE